MTLSEQQRVAYDRALAFLGDPDPARPYWVMSGLAGTGKTETLSAIAHACPDGVLCAFTGKAASVLRRRTGLHVDTLHGRLYNPPKEGRDHRGRKSLDFSSRGEDHTGKKFFVDEMSMIGPKLGMDLVATKARIIACGDPGQLPPINGVQFFTDPDYTLTEVHRQAWESPIIRQAHAVRSGGMYQADGDAFRVISRSDMTEEDVSFGDIALCYRNETRRRLNVSRRRARQITGKVLLRGEPVMTLRNDKRLKIYNGETYRVDEDREPGEDLKIVDHSGRKISLQNVVCEMIDPGFEELRYDQDSIPVTLCYASTTHKYQGSEADDILLIDEYDKEVNRRSWVYTSLTRAAKRIRVVYN